MDNNISLPLITIAIPFHNTEKYIRSCLDSVVSQDYAKLEILLCDDSSTDLSAGIVSDYSSGDKRIRLIKCNGRGPADARNSLLKESNGDYIFFVDSDDTLPVNAVGDMLVLIGEHDMAMCGYTPVFACEKREGRQRYAKEGILDSKRAIHDFFLTDANRYGHMWGKLIKRDVLVGLEFSKVELYEDIAFLPKLIERLDSCIVTAESYYNYTIHTESSSFDEDMNKQVVGLRVRMDNVSFYETNYPLLADAARLSALDFAFFLLGRMDRSGKAGKCSEWEYTLETTDKLIKDIHDMKGTYRAAAMLFKLSPVLAAKAFRIYSMKRNHTDR